MPGAISVSYLHAHHRGIARREILSFAAFGLSVLALAVPTVWVSWARMNAISAASPLGRGATRRRAGGGPGGAASPEMIEELARLRARVARLEDERHRLEEELAKQSGLGAARELARMDIGRFIEALVIGHAVNWQDRSFIIDRGSEDGVVPRAGVLAGGVVAGMVVETGPHAARVAMLTEHGARVAARTLSTRRAGLSVGTGESCELRYVDRWAAGASLPRADESVVTSGRFGFFPPGFVVGRVASVGVPRDALHLNIAIRPELAHPPEGRVWILRPGPGDVRPSRDEERGGAP